jgi:hypothetical protein
MAAYFTLGPPMKLTATFNDVTGAPIDYSTVQFSYAIARPGNIEQTLIYSSGGSGYSTIIKSSTGVYYVQLLTTGLAGLWTYGWQGLDGSGNIQAQAFDEVLVQADGSGLF